MTKGYERFLVAMMTTKDEALRKADPEKLAEKYSVCPLWARMSLENWMTRG